MDMEEQKNLYGDPDKVVHYMDYISNPVPDNSRYIPDLVPGVLQPLELVDDDPVLDNIISKIDIEKIISEVEAETKKVE